MSNHILSHHIIISYHNMSYHTTSWFISSLSYREKSVQGSDCLLPQLRTRHTCRRSVPTLGSFQSTCKDAIRRLKTSLSESYHDWSWSWCLRISYSLHHIKLIILPIATNTRTYRTLLLHGCTWQETRVRQ